MSTGSIEGGERVISYAVTVDGVDRRFELLRGV